MRKRRRKGTSFLSVFLKILIIFALASGSYYVYAKMLSNPLVKSLDVEAGTTNLKIKDFLKEKKKDQDIEGTLKEPFTTQESRELGEHVVTFVVGRSEYKTTVNIVDTTPPEIEGVKALKVKIGNAVAYKSGVTVNDNADGDIQLDVDTSDVNLEKSGTYNVTYIATDASGNVAKKKTTIKMYRFSNAEKAYNATMKRAQALLKRITKSSDSKAVKLKKAFKWCAKVRYTTPRNFPNNFLNKTWPSTYADDCFIKGRGDCHSSAAAFAYLCEAIGYENVTLNQDKRHPGKGAHSWVAVNGKYYDPLWSRTHGWKIGWAVSPSKYKYKSARSRSILLAEN